jgi:hypothetical protein
MRYWLEALHRLRLQVIPRQVKLCVVHRKTALSSIRSAQKRLHRDHGHTVVGAVGWVLEVQDGGPVVGEVVGHLARGAGSARGNVTRHAGVEGISADDVVDVGGGERAWLDDWVEALDCESRAWEAQTSFDRRKQREGGGEGLHLGEARRGDLWTCAWRC